jgi:hypothetical protein
MGRSPSLRIQGGDEFAVEPRPVRNQSTDDGVLGSTGQQCDNPDQGPGDTNLWHLSQSQREWLYSTQSCHQSDFALFASVDGVMRGATSVVVRVVINPHSELLRLAN